MCSSINVCLEIIYLFQCTQRTRSKLEIKTMTLKVNLRANNLPVSQRDYFVSSLKDHSINSPFKLVPLMLMHLRTTWSSCSQSMFWFSTCRTCRTCRMGLRVCISNKLSSDANAVHRLSNKNLNKRSSFSQSQVAVFQGVK